MCGICGFISIEAPIEATSLMEMNAAIRHRGPDDEGYISVEGSNVVSYSGPDTIDEIKKVHPRLQLDQRLTCGMGFRRLSILDVTHLGHQPMVDAQQHIAVTFNGEIYNFKELRQELKDNGHHFESHSDTEVILKGYLQWGIKVVDRLNGMFAIAILDHSKHTLWLVRDRMGIKPLFYHIADRKIGWASEIKSLLRLPWIKKEINFTALAANFMMQTTPSPHTCFKNILSVPPAHLIEVDTLSLSVKYKEYWKIPRQASASIKSLNEATEQVDLLLKKAVARTLISDVPVISLMSGGIDSTTITALAALADPNIDSYTLGFDATGRGADEIPQAKAMADKLGIRQTIHIIRPEDITNNLLEALEHFEEPYHSLEVVMEASNHIYSKGYKVALNGNGADELFGGYGYVLRLKDWQARRKLGVVHPFIPPVNAWTRKVKNYLGLNSVFRFYVNARQGMRLHDLEALMPAGQGVPPKTMAGQLQVDESRYEENYEALFYYDMHYSVASHHVYRDDMSAMRHSVEMRYPYLDHELIELVAALPVEYRYNGVINKPLLRNVAQRYITHENLSMPKKGFALPGDAWMKDNKAIMTFAQQQIGNLKKRQLFNNRTIDQWMQNSSDPLVFHKIWQLVTTEVWLNKYID